MTTSSTKTLHLVKINLKYFILRHEEKQICLFVESGFFKLKQPLFPQKMKLNGLHMYMYEGLLKDFFEILCVICTLLTYFEFFH